MKNCHFIVRTIGERTLGLAIHAYNKKGIYPTVITGKPFGETLQRCFKNALEENKEFTVMVDADMIPVNGFSISYLVSIIQDQKCFEVHVSGLDQYFQSIRQIGVRIYKTNELKKGIKEIDVLSKRPESELIHKYGFYHKKKVMVTHGFEQYYKDLQRSAISIANKNSEKIILDLKKKLKINLDKNINDRRVIINIFESVLYGKRLDKLIEKNYINEKDYDKLIEEQNINILKEW